MLKYSRCNISTPILKHTIHIGQESMRSADAFFVRGTRINTDFLFGRVVVLFLAQITQMDADFFSSIFQSFNFSIFQYLKRAQIFSFLQSFNFSIFHFF